MKRAPIVEDWSRFNRAVLEVADGRPIPSKPNTPQQPARAPDPQTDDDGYGLIARHKWRKHA